MSYENIRNRFYKARIEGTTVDKDIDRSLDGLMVLEGYKWEGYNRPAVWEARVRLKKMEDYGKK